jgi:hypothetical protein
MCGDLDHLPSTLMLCVHQMKILFLLFFSARESQPLLRRDPHGLLGLHSQGSGVRCGTSPRLQFRSLSSAGAAKQGGLVPK